MMTLTCFQVPSVDWNVLLKQGRELTGHNISATMDASGDSPKVGHLPSCLGEFSFIVANHTRIMEMLDFSFIGNLYRSLVAEIAINSHVIILQAKTEAFDQDYEGVILHGSLHDWVMLINWSKSGSPKMQAMGGLLTSFFESIGLNKNVLRIK